MLQKRRCDRPLCAAFLSGLFLCGTSAAATADTAETMALKLHDTGKREYYCTATFKLSAGKDPAYQDVNGYFYVFVGDEQVGRSKGASFRFNGGETTASATFETPNAPCTDVDGYVFVIGACMQNNAFVDQSACAASIAPSGPVRQIRAR
ncbi:MAG: hypothetical protein AAF724_00015 [Pseudomonadota bacterium]